MDTFTCSNNCDKPGEESGGCTYDIENKLGFSQGTSSQWKQVDKAPIPKWVAIHDRFVAYKRK